MSDKHVVVVGSGAAGTAAALAARAEGARVTMIRGRTGATSLGSGAVDGSAEGGTSQTKTRGESADGVPTLDLWDFGACTLATSAGTIRRAAGRDRALADLDRARGPVLVARVVHPAWDGGALAAAWSEQNGRGFVARDVGLVLQKDERSMQHVELAALHDDPQRLARAAERIRDALGAGGEFGAVLLPPWLGVSAPRAAELSALVGVPCGETLVAVDGPAGLRFERARDRHLQNANIETIPGAVTRVKSSGPGYEVSLGDRPLAADVVVLATGGLLGALDYAPATGFALSFDAPVTLGRDGRPLVVPGSVFGVPPESLTWPYADPPALETVGMLAVDGSAAGGTSRTRDEELRVAPRIFACGDALEGTPRTMLAALTTGSAAGRAAARA